MCADIPIFRSRDRSSADAYSVFCCAAKCLRFNNPGMCDVHLMLFCVIRDEIDEYWRQFRDRIRANDIIIENSDVKLF